jgi:hypothetical protein
MEDGSRVVLFPGYLSQDPGVPKRLWFMWLQGLDAAPPVVQRCYESWSRRNGDWDITFLSHDNLQDWIDFDLSSEKFSTLPKNHLSDLIRLSLLTRFGGVWADATSFCVQPLDSWLPKCTTSGFFAFCTPGRDRMISSWFLAAAPDNAIVVGLYELMLRYWRDSDFHEQHDRRLGRRGLSWGLGRLLNRSIAATHWWFSPLVQDTLRVYPYYVFHYTFAELIRNDHTARVIWARTPRIKADVAHRLQVEGLSQPLSSDLRSEIDDGVAPLYKLTWKCDPTWRSYLSRNAPSVQIVPGSVLDYLLQQPIPETDLYRG